MEQNMSNDLKDILELADPERLADQNLLEICDLVEAMAAVIKSQQATIEQQKIIIDSMEAKEWT